MALPTSLAYMQKPSAVASRSMRSSIAPVNGASFSGSNGQTIRLEIPTGIQGQYLNPAQSFLKFSVTTTQATAGLRVDNSIYSIFDRLVISHNGVVLEQIDQYGVLANALLDFQCNSSQLNNDLNIMMGTTAPTDAGTGASGGITIAPAAKTWFSMPLLSSLFTMLGDKYVPIGDIRNEIRIELTLAPQGFVRTSTPTAGSAYTYVVEDVELLLDIVELDPAVSAEIRKETLSREGAFKLPVVQWRNFNSVIPIGAGSASVIIPAKMNSLKNLLVIQRNQMFTVSDQQSKNHRLGADITNYWFQVGSHYVPAKPVSNLFESYAELQKSMHDLSIGNGDSIINRTSYNGLKYMIGCELESLSHRSDVLNSGLNSTSLNIYWNPSWTTPTGETRRVDTFAHYDALVMIDPTGQMNVVF